MIQFFYDEGVKMWECSEKSKDGRKIKILIGQWHCTLKGDLISIEVEGEMERSCDIEIIRKKELTADELVKYSRGIIDVCNRFHKDDIFRFSGLGSVFKEEKKFDAYMRQFNEVTMYMGQRGGKRMSAVSAEEFRQKKCPEPALRFPGTRCDSIF